MNEIIKILADMPGNKYPTFELAPSEQIMTINAVLAALTMIMFVCTFITLIPYLIKRHEYILYKKNKFTIRNAAKSEKTKQNELKTRNNSPAYPTKLRNLFQNMLFWSLLTTLILLAYSSLSLYLIENERRIIFDNDTTLFIIMVIFAIALCITPFILKLCHKEKLANAFLVIGIIITTTALVLFFYG